MKRKKVLIFASCLLTILLCACSKETTQKQNGLAKIESKDASATESTEGTASATETDEKQAESDSTAARVSIDDTLCKPIKIEVGSGRLYEWDDYLRKMTVTVIAPAISLPSEYSEKYPELAKTFEARNKEFEENQKSIFEEFKTLVKDDIEVRGSEYFNGYTSTKKLVVKRCDTTAVSYVLDYSDYSGGAHGYYSLTGENYDTVTGQKLSLEDVIVNKDAFVKEMASALTSSYDAEYFYDDLNAEAYINDNYNDLSWSLCYDGIMLYFNPYEVGPYASGLLLVKLPFTDGKGIIADKYMTVPESYAFALNGFYPDRYDIDNDGTLDEITAYGEFDEYDVCNSVSITVNNNIHETDFYSYELSPYIVHTADNRNFIYMEAVSENDYRSIYAYEFQNGKIKDLGYTDGGFKGRWDDSKDILYREVFTNPDDFVLESTLHILGTASGYKNYRVGDNGSPVSDDTVFTIISPYELVNSVEFNADLMDENLEVVKKVTIPAGEKLLYIMTDGEKYGYLKSPKGNILRVEINFDDWPYRVNGIDIEKLFEGIMFAG